MFTIFYDPHISSNPETSSNKEQRTIRVNIILRTLNNKVFRLCIMINILQHYDEKDRSEMLTLASSCRRLGYVKDQRHVTRV